MKSVLTMLSLFFSVLLSGQGFVEICPGETTNGTLVNFEVFNDTLFATGFMNVLCGETVSYLAFWDDGEWAPAPVGLADAGHSLYPYGDSMLIARYEESIDSNWLLVYHEGALTRWGEGIYLTTASGLSEFPNIYDVIEFQGDIYVCGEFDRVGTQSISGIMRWDGSQWTDVGGGLSGNIQNTGPVLFPHGMGIWNDQLIVGGNFRFAGGVEVNGIASWDGSTWSALGSGFNNTAYDIHDYFGVLYVGGSFTSSGGTPLNRIATWNGTSWESPGYGFEPANSNDFTFVHTLKQIGERLFIGGGLRQLVLPGVPNQSIGGLIAVDPGGTIFTFNGGVPNNDIEGIAQVGDDLIVGGGVFGNGYSGILDLSVSIVNPALEKVMEVLPNPAVDYVQVKFSRAIPNGELQVFDITGREVSNSPISGLSLELPVYHLPKGQYFLRIKGEAGVQLGQFIKQ